MFLLIHCLNTAMHSCCNYSLMAWKAFKFLFNSVSTHCIFFCLQTCRCGSPTEEPSGDETRSWELSVARCPSPPVTSPSAAALIPVFTSLYHSMPHQVNLTHSSYEGQLVKHSFIVGICINTQIVYLDTFQVVCFYLIFLSLFFILINKQRYLMHCWRCSV